MTLKGYVVVEEEEEDCKGMAFSAVNVWLGKVVARLPYWAPRIPSDVRLELISVGGLLGKGTVDGWLCEKE